MFLVKNVLDLPIEDTQVILFDKHTDGPFHELIQKAYSPNHPVIRHQHYAGKKVCPYFPLLLSLLNESLFVLVGFVFATDLSLGIACWVDLPEGVAT